MRESAILGGQAIARTRRRPTRHAAVVKLLEVVVAIAFLLLMINVVLPWAADALVTGFTSTIGSSRR